jgi:hypothetical protein
MVVNVSEGQEQHIGQRMQVLAGWLSCSVGFHCSLHEIWKLQLYKSREYVSIIAFCLAVSESCL